MAEPRKEWCYCECRECSDGECEDCTNSECTDEICASWKATAQREREASRG